MIAQYHKLALTAGFALAMVFTFSCSSDDDGDKNDGYENDGGSPVGGENNSSSGGGGSNVGSSSSIGSVGSSSSGSSGPVLIGTSGTFEDERDGNIYKWVKIDEQFWMAENLNYRDKGVCNPYIIDCKYGRLYDWATAMGAESFYNNSKYYLCGAMAPSCRSPSNISGICPAGWRIPNNNDWSKLTSYVESNSGCSNCVNKHLKAKDGWGSGYAGTDTYGFSAQAGGYGDVGIYGYSQVGNVGYWWSADDNYSDTNASYMCIGYEDDVGCSNSKSGGLNARPQYKYDEKVSLYSVRCLLKN